MWPSCKISCDEANAGLAEVDLGRLAQQKTSSSKVKASVLARPMDKIELKELAESDGSVLRIEQ